MLARRLVSFQRAGARFISSSRVLAEAAPVDKKDEAKPLVDPSNPEIVPSNRIIHQYKNRYWEKRGYTLAPMDWKGWEDLPEGPLKYAPVKVDPAHVENPGFFFKTFSDWKTGIPTAFLFSMPLWMFNVLPPFDERMELAGITLAAGYMALKQIGPMVRAWKRSRVGNKNKAMLQHEKELNDEIEGSVGAFVAGANVVQYIKSMNNAERALRGLEAVAATKRIAAAQRDALVHQLDYLVSVAAAGAADTEGTVVKAARASVEAQLEKDAALQQKTIEAAIKALKDGSAAEDLIEPLFAKAMQAARAEAKAQPAARPFVDPKQIEMFNKRFGFVESAVSESTLARAKADSAAMAVLTGKVGGKAPTVGAAYTIKPAIAYAK